MARTFCWAAQYLLAHVIRKVIRDINKIGKVVLHIHYIIKLENIPIYQENVALRLSLFSIVILPKRKEKKACKNIRSIDWFPQPRFREKLANMCNWSKFGFPRWLNCSWLHHNIRTCPANSKPASTKVHHRHRSRVC